MTEPWAPHKPRDKKEITECPGASSFSTGNQDQGWGFGQLGGC